jgi:hypothetical protein
MKYRNRFIREEMKLFDNAYINYKERVKKYKEI